MNGTSLPTNVNSTLDAIADAIANANVDALVNSTSLNNEQVVRQEPTALPHENNVKTTDAEPAIPYPQNG